MSDMRLCVVGKGRVGTALALAFANAGLATTHVAARALPGSLTANVYLLCVRDPYLGETTRAVLDRHCGSRAVFLHTAGAVPSEVLRVAGAVSAAVLHPLLAFAGGITPVFAGAVFAMEGDADALRTASELLKFLDAHPVQLDATQLPTYHAAAVLASNHILALVDHARELLVGLGVDSASADKGLASLLGGVAANLNLLGLPFALTGPTARGDVESVRAHLSALQSAPDARLLYLTTLPRVVALARGKGEADISLLDQIEQLAKE